MKIVIAGYYGCGNLGDDALLAGLLAGIKGLNATVVATSGDPSATSAAFGIDAVPRKEIRAVTSEIRTADALVFGGGGLLQDATSLLSLKYYTHLIDTASRAGKPIALVGQGVGPIRSFLGKRAARRAFEQCDLITVRDQGSRRLVEQLAPKSRARLEVTDDLAWMLPQRSPEPASKAVVVSARPWKAETDGVVAALTGFCQRAVSAGWEVVPASFDRSMDDGVLDRICPNASTRLYTDNPTDLLAGVGAARATVAMRLHAGIFSAINCVPAQMIAYDPKVEAFAASTGNPAIPLPELSAEGLWSRFERVIANADELGAAAKERASAGREASIRGVELLRSLLGDTSARQ